MRGRSSKSPSTSSGSAIRRLPLCRALARFTRDRRSAGSGGVQLRDATSGVDFGGYACAQRCISSVTETRTMTPDRFSLTVVLVESRTRKPTPSGRACAGRIYDAYSLITSRTTACITPISFGAAGHPPVLTLAEKFMPLGAWLGVSSVASGANRHPRKSASRRSGAANQILFVRDSYEAFSRDLAAFKSQQPTGAPR
jgi:hypothetical protein